ncbi:uncharacterized protein LOC144424279 isoform X2 [Styela clava]
MKQCPATASEEVDLKKSSGVISSPLYPKDFNPSDCKKWILPHQKYSKKYALVTSVIDMILRHKMPPEMPSITNQTFEYSLANLTIAGHSLAQLSPGECLIFHPTSRTCSNDLDNFSQCLFKLHHYEALSDPTITFNISHIMKYKPRRFKLRYEYKLCSGSKDQTSFGSVGAAIAFGIISALEALLLVAVAVRRYRKRGSAFRKTKEKTVTSTTVLENNYGAGSDPIYHTVGNPAQAAQSETVFNELYTIT